MNFKDFLVCEQQVSLSQKIGPILGDAQQLRDQANKLAVKHLAQFSGDVVRKIRDILHSHWSDEQVKYLERLRIVAFNIADAIKEKGDLPGIIAASVEELDKIVKDIGSPINSLAVDPGTDNKETDSKGTSPAIKNVPNKDQSKPPAQTKTVDSAVTATNPLSNDPESVVSPPLGGSSGTLDAF
jgi:hypothetical protein